MKKSILVLMIIFLSCVKENSSVLSENEIKEYKIKVLKTGNKSCFTMLLLNAQNNDEYYEMLPYSIIIANKFKNTDAFYNVYECMIRINNNGSFKEDYIERLNKCDKEFAISYLNKGAYLNDIDCKVSLSKHYRYGFGVIKNIKKADSIYSSIK